MVRKAMLRDALKGARRIIYVTHFEHSGAELWKAVKKLEPEGIVAKEASSIYTAGRTTRWQKIKTAIGAEREKKRRPK